MTKYFFIRHGESQANVDRVFAGVMESPLTEKGRQAARAEGDRLRAANETFDLIISSPLERARKTAQIIAQATGYNVTDIIIEPLLTERNFGSIAGQSWDSLPNEASDVFKEAGGESLDELATRVSAAVERIKILGRGKNRILLIGHGSWYQMAETILEGRHARTFLESTSIPNNQVFSIAIGVDVERGQDRP